MTIHITTTRAVAALVLALAYVALTPATPAAADREHQQIMADLRILQEQTQQLQALMTDLGEALKAVNSRIEDQTSLERKAFADGKVQMDTMSGDLRIVREKVDETNVRLGTITQELESIRQAIPEPGAFQQLPVNTDPTAAPGTTPGGSAPPPTSIDDVRRIRAFSRSGSVRQRRGATTPAATTPSPSQGFDSYLRSFPKHTQAHEAQLYIGESLAWEKKDMDAVAAYDRVIANYPGSPSVPTAYYKRGMAFERLGEAARARESYEALIKQFPDSQQAVLAKQRLEPAESADQIGGLLQRSGHSMGSVNKVILVGNLGRDAELRYTPGGAAVATLNLATTEVFKDREGQKKEDTQWHRVILWGKTAETLQDYLTKGKQIYVEGKLQTRKWKDKDGNDKYTTEVRGDRVVLLSGGGRGDGAGRGEGGGGRSTPAAAADDFGHAEPGGSVELTDDDIPF